MLTKQQKIVKVTFQRHQKTKITIFVLIYLKNGVDFN